MSKTEHQLKRIVLTTLRGSASSLLVKLFSCFQIPTMAGTVCPRTRVGTTSGVVRAVATQTAGLL